MARIIDLPTELLSQIAQYLVTAHIGYQDAGLRNLRLTCRTLRDKTDYDFYKAAFSTLKIDLHEESLASLNAFCSHPYNCDAVKRLVFAHDMKETVSLGQLDEMDDEFRMMTIEENVRLLLKSVFIGAFQKLRNLKEVVITTPFAAKFLRFSSSLDQFGLRNYDCEAPTIVDEHLRWRFPVEECTVAANILFLLITEVASVTHLDLNTLEITDSYRSYMPPRDPIWSCWSVSIYSLPTWRQSFQQLRHLRLSIDVTAPEPTLLHPIQYDGSGIKDMTTLLSETLNHSKNLTELKLSFLRSAYGYPNRGDRRALQVLQSLSTIHLPHLTHFHMSNGVTEEETLVKFLLSHRCTLQTLILEIAMLLRGTWHSVFTSLLDSHMPKLSAAEFLGLYEGSVRRRFSWN